MSQELTQAQPKTPKARAVIAEAVMRLFQEHGYELIVLGWFPVVCGVIRRLIAVADALRDPAG